MRKTYLLSTIQADTIMKSRWPLLEAMLSKGWDVHVAMPRSRFAADLRERGVHVHEYDLRRGSTNPFREARTLSQYRAIVRSVDPILAHHFSTKAVIYGSLAGRGITISTITGIGHSLSGGNGLKSIPVRTFAPGLYRRALRRCNRVVFQNEGDREVFVERGIVDPGRTSLILGSGVDMAYYHPCRRRRKAPDCVRFVMLSRLIATKGVREFAAAAGRVRENLPLKARFVLAGPLDPENPSCIQPKELDYWQERGLIEWRGPVSDAVEAYADADVAVLPSYAEGLPRAMVEGAAMGLPVITTTHPGCAATVVPDESGLLVPPRDVESLADACRTLAEDEDLRSTMGTAGRRYVESRFGTDTVIEQTLELYDEELTKAGLRGLAA